MKIQFSLKRNVLIFTYNSQFFKLISLIIYYIYNNFQSGIIHREDQENHLDKQFYAQLEPRQVQLVPMCENQQYEVLITIIEANFYGYHKLHLIWTRGVVTYAQNSVSESENKIAYTNVEKLKYQYESNEQQIYLFNLQMNHLKKHRISFRQNQIRQLKRIFYNWLEINKNKYTLFMKNYNLEYIKIIINSSSDDSKTAFSLYFYSKQVEIQQLA